MFGRHQLEAKAEEFLPCCTDTSWLAPLSIQFSGPSAMQLHYSYIVLSLFMSFGPRSIERVRTVAYLRFINGHILPDLRLRLWHVTFHSWRFLIVRARAGEAWNRGYGKRCLPEERVTLQ